MAETDQIVLSYSTQSFLERVLSSFPHLPTSLDPDSLSSILMQRIFLKSPPTISSISPSIVPNSSEQSPYLTFPTNSTKMSVEFFEEILFPPFSIRDLEISEIIAKQILLLRDRLELTN